MPSDNKDYQPIIWPIGKWKGWDVRKIPVNHLNWFLKQPIRTDNIFWIDWRNKVVQELERRHSYQIRFHFTEHLYERFTQYWPRFVSHYQGLVNKDAGVVTILRRLFARALENGASIPDPDDKSKFIIIDHNYRWVYTSYMGEDVENQKAITIFKVKNEEKKASNISETSKEDM